MVCAGEDLPKPDAQVLGTVLELSSRTVYPVRVVIVYYSRFGAIKTLAEHIQAGACQVAGVEARLMSVDDWPFADPNPAEPGPATVTKRAAALNQLIGADAIIVGSPGYFGSMAASMKRLFEECAISARPPTTDRSRPWRHYLFHDKVGAAFTSTATPHGGNEETLHSILTMLMHFGIIVVTPGQQQPILENETAPYGPTAITGPTGDRPPAPDVLTAAREFGQRVAEVTVCLRLGQVRWLGEELLGSGLESEGPLPADILGRIAGRPPSAVT